MSELEPDYPFPNPRVVRADVLPKLAVKPWLIPPSPSVYFTNCSIIDPAAGKLLDGPHVIEITAGEFVAVSPSEGFQYANVDAPKIDLTGKYVCPGLIDAHVHATAIPGTATMTDMVRTSDQLVTLRSTFVLKSMLSRGFTSVRDCGGASKNLALSIAENLIEGPRLFQCGKAISQTGGHADYSPAVSGGNAIGCCGGHVQSLGRTADGVPMVLAAVREELKQGADFIKIMLGGGVSSETDGIETVQYSPEEVRAVTSSAWQMGKKMVTAHAYTVDAINHAVSNGVKGIEHGNLLDEPTAKMMAEKGIYLTPTLSCYGIMARKPFENFLPPDGQIKNREVMQQGLQALKLAEEAGVTVCYGSDLLISMHALQTEEFTVRSQVLSAAAILRHATVNPAKMLNHTGKIGTIAPGAFADLLVLSRNPLEDITVLDRPEQYLDAVVKDGRLMVGQLEGFPR